MNYYVYAYFDGETPIYIGAGCRDRDIKHLKSCAKGRSYFHNKLRKMQREGFTPTVRRLLDNLTFQESRDWERFFIQTLGRKNLKTGPLYNLTDGGEGVLNFIVSNTTKQRMSESAKVAHARLEVKQQHSMATKAAMSRSEVKQKILESNKQFEVKRRRSEAIKINMAQPRITQQISETMKAFCRQPKIRQQRSKIRRFCPPKGSFKGVYRSLKKWYAKIDGKYLGTFDTPEAAAQAYNDAVDKYWNGVGYKNQLLELVDNG
jgi:hypothetical protein